MGAIANTKITLANSVANGITFNLAYPPGTDQNKLNYSTGGRMAVNQDVWKQDAMPGFIAAFGASNITITNNTGGTLPNNAEVWLSFGTNNRNGSYNLVLGPAHDQAAYGDIKTMTLMEEEQLDEPQSVAVRILQSGRY